MRYVVATAYSVSRLPEVREHVLTRITGNNVDGGMQSCGGDLFCCAGDESSGICNCETGNGVFTLLDGAAQTIIGVDVPPPTGSPTFATGVPTQPALTSAQTPSPPGQVASQSSPKQIGTQSSMSYGATATPNGNSTGGSPAPVTDSVGFKAGVGIGVVAAAAAIGTGLALLYRRYRKQNHNKQEEEHNEPDQEDTELGTARSVRSPSIPDNPEPDPNQIGGGFIYEGRIPYYQNDPLVHGGYMSPPQASNPFDPPAAQLQNTQTRRSKTQTAFA